MRGDTLIRKYGFLIQPINEAWEKYVTLTGDFEPVVLMSIPGITSINGLEVRFHPLVPADQFYLVYRAQADFIGNRYSPT